GQHALSRRMRPDAVWWASLYALPCQSVRMSDRGVAPALRAGAGMLFAVALTIAVSAPTALAQRAGSPAACRAEIQEFCSNLEPRRSTVQSCLEDHSGDLSSSCRALLQERTQHVHAHDPRSCGQGAGSPACPAKHPHHE